LGGRPRILQKIEFDATTAEGPSRVTIVSGILPLVGLGAGAISTTQNLSVSALVDPTLTPGQFRKATAIAALTGTSADLSAGPNVVRCSIDNVEASLDDESGRIEIRIDAQVGIAPIGTLSIHGFTFQVTTLAKL
jgi:hypothetical protein